MHLLLLGLVLVVGILVYYIMTTSGKAPSADKKKEPLHKASENLRKEDNVIFLPTADGTKPDDAGEAHTNADEAGPDTDGAGPDAE